MGGYGEKLELILQESAVHRQVQGGTVLQTDTWYHVVTEIEDTHGFIAILIVKIDGCLVSFQVSLALL